MPISQHCEKSPEKFQNIFDTRLTDDIRKRMYSYSSQEFFCGFLKTDERKLAEACESFLFSTPKENTVTNSLF